MTTETDQLEELRSLLFPRSDQQNDETATEADAEVPDRSNVVPLEGNNPTPGAGEDHTDLVRALFN